MPQHLESYISCNVEQLFELSNDPEDSIKCLSNLVRTEEVFYANIILFADVVRKYENRADLLTDYIREFKLGSVYLGKNVKNPNSKNNVRVYTWYVNQRELYRHLKKLDVIS